MAAESGTQDQKHSSLRALEIFNAFQSSKRALTLSEIATATSIPMSTCHGVVKVLEQTGYLCSLSGREIYPTGKLWEIADTIRIHDPILERLGPRLRELSEACGETVILGARQGERVQYLLVIESQQAIRYSASVGAFKPLHSSAIGKVILGTMPAHALDNWIGSHELSPVTKKTLTSARTLRADLERGAARGYWVTRGENVPDVMALAIPVRLDALVLGAAIAGPIQRLEPAEKKLARLLHAAKPDLERAYAG